MTLMSFTSRANKPLLDMLNGGHLQVLRYLPAHIRWQEKLDLEFPTLKGRLQTIDSLKTEFTEVYEHYIMPVLEQCRDPLALAEFQLRAATGLRSTRLPREQPRYAAGNPYISTALLLDEAGATARAVAFLERVREDLSRQGAARDPAATTRVNGQLDRLLAHLRTIKKA